MATCADCKAFFPIEEKYDDYEPGKGDCVHELSDKKGKWWDAKPVRKDMEACKEFMSKG